MALILCPACGKQVSEQAPTCPQCGQPIAAPTAPPTPQKIVVEQPKSGGSGVLKRILLWMTPVLLILLFLSCPLGRAGVWVVFETLFALTHLGDPKLPEPVIVDHKTESKLLADTELQVSVQNTGPPGQVTVFATQGNKQVRQKVFLNEGERRVVVLQLTGFKSEPFQFNVIASESEEGKIIGN
jgi:zinc-ribbon domain